MEDKLDKIIELLVSIEHRQANPFGYWTVEEEMYVAEMYAKKESYFDIAVGIKQKFNVSRSSSAVKKRIVEMELKVKEKPPKVNFIPDNFYDSIF